MESIFLIIGCYSFILLPERQVERRVRKTTRLITSHNTIWTNNGVEGKEYKESLRNGDKWLDYLTQEKSWQPRYFWLQRFVLLQYMNSFCQELGPGKFSTSHLIYVSEVEILHGLHSLSFMISLRLTISTTRHWQGRSEFPSFYFANSLTSGDLDQIVKLI